MSDPQGAAVRNFTTEAPAVMTTLRHLQHESDLASLRYASLRLHTISASAGATRLTALCGQIRQLAEKQDRKGIARLIQDAQGWVDVYSAVLSGGIETISETQAGLASPPERELANSSR
jgi:HPt (histidine-containing phosphotransfer) domain-containing protein